VLNVTSTVRMTISVKNSLMIITMEMHHQSLPRKKNSTCKYLHKIMATVFWERYGILFESYWREMPHVPFREVY